MGRVVIDTNIFVSALLNSNGAPREILRLALRREITPLFGDALFSEYEDVLARDEIFGKCVLNGKERSDLFDALLSVSDWVRIHFLWRPNLPDEADNHIVELAVAGGAEAVITANVRDFMRAELKFMNLSIVNAASYLKRRTNR